MSSMLLSYRSYLHKSQILGTKDMVVRMMRVKKLDLVCSIALLASGILFMANGVVDLYWTYLCMPAGSTRYGPPVGILLIPGTVLTVLGVLLSCVSINIAPKRIERIFNRRWR